MLEHTTRAMRQSGSKQEQRHATPSRPSPAHQPTNEPPHGAEPAASSADLACAANRGTTPHPAAGRPARDAFTPPPPGPAEPGDPGKIWLTLADVAEELDVSTRTVMRWAERGQFPAVILPGGRKRIHRDAFHTWLANLPLSNGGT